MRALVLAAAAVGLIAVGYLVGSWNARRGARGARAELHRVADQGARDTAALIGVRMLARQHRDIAPELADLIELEINAYFNDRDKRELRP